MFYMGSGDRTPKQKVKLKVTEEKLLNLMLKYNGGRPRSEVISFMLYSFMFCFIGLLGVNLYFGLYFSFSYADKT